MAGAAHASVPQFSILRVLEEGTVLVDTACDAIVNYFAGQVLLTGRSGQKSLGAPDHQRCRVLGIA